MITKSDLEALILPPNYQTLAEQFHAKTRENLERLEELESRLSALRRAEIQAKIRRELYSPQELPELPWLRDEVVETIPNFNETLRRRDEVSAAHTARVCQIMAEKKLQLAASVEDAACDEMKKECHRLDGLLNSICRDFIREIFVSLREHKDFSSDQKAFADAFKESHGFALSPESIWENPLIGNILVEPVDTLYLREDQSSVRRMTQGVMNLTGAVCAKFKSVAVLNPGAGHLPATIASKAGPFVSILPLKKYWAGSELIPFAKDYAQAGSSKVVLAYESVEEFILAAERRIHFQGKRDALVLDVGTVGRLPRMFSEALDAVSDGIDSHGTCLAYVSAVHFPRIKPLFDKVISVTVLPPLPADPKDSNVKVLSQGFLVEIAMNKAQPRGVVAIFDATRIMPMEKMGLDLDNSAIVAISKAINDDTSVEGVMRATVKREAFVRHEEWPGLISLLGLSYDTLMVATPETIHDERERLEREKELLDKELLKEGDAGLVFRRMQAAKEAQADTDKQ